MSGTGPAGVVASKPDLLAGATGNLTNRDHLVCIRNALPNEGSQAQRRIE